jgi:hypothetical protein
MKLLNKNIFITLTTIITLSACGGGDESHTQNNNSNSSNVGNANSATISGQFFSSHDTGKFFSTEDYPSYNQYGKNARHCYQSYNDYYFESEETMVFGNPNLPENDFKQAAAWVENNFSSVLTSMGVSEQAFFLQRTNIRIDARKHLRNLLENKSISSVTYPDGFDFWLDHQVFDWATKTVKNLSNTEIQNALLNSSQSRYQSKQDFVVQEKIYVCLHEKTSDWGFGEGTPLGINIGAESIHKPNDINKLIHHELIHTVQLVLSSDLDGNKLSKWLKEGQAVYLSDMDIAKRSDHNQYDPTLIVYSMDQTGDPSLAYKHYGLAYKYLVDANGTSILAMMKNMKALSLDHTLQLNSILNEDHNYVEAFNSHMKQQNGSSLTVSEYREDYHALMSAYAND